MLVCAQAWWSRLVRGTTGGRLHYVSVAGFGEAPDQVQKLGKIQLAIAVNVQLFHHAVHNARVFLVLCERCQLCVHEGHEFLLGERSGIPITARIALEDGQERLYASFGLRGANWVPR